MPIMELRKLIEKYPSIGFVQTYGQTECSPRVTALLPMDAVRKIGSVGKAIPNVEIMIFMQKQVGSVKDGIGEIIVKGKNIMKGYYKKPETTREIYRDGWLHTGDVGYIDEEGYLYLTGRIKNIIISGGINIYPEEIEQILMTYEKVEEICVIGEANKMMGEVPVAKIVTKTSITDKELRKYCSERLAAYKIPVRFDFVDSLPKTYTGKIKRLEEK